MAAIFRLIVIALACVALGPSASACPILTHSSIFYSADDVLAPPPDVEVIADVTILAEGATCDHMQLGIVRVDKPIKGPVTDTIRIAHMISDCNFMFSVGDHGIVMGKLRTTPRGEVELMAISEPALTKRFRRERNHINTRNG